MLKDSVLIAFRSFRRNKVSFFINGWFFMTAALIVTSIAMNSKF